MKKPLRTIIPKGAPPANVRGDDVSEAHAPSYRSPESGKEILVPASVRIAKEKAAAKLQAARDRKAARAHIKAAREERAITQAALRIAKTLDRLAAQKEREAAKLERKAQRIAFELARKDRLEEQRLAKRARKKQKKKKKVTKVTKVT